MTVLPKNNPHVIHSFNCGEKGNTWGLKMTNFSFKTEFYIHLKEAFAALTGTHSIVLAGGVVPTHRTAPFISCWTLDFGRQLIVHQGRTVPAAVIQLEWTEAVLMAPSKILIRKLMLLQLPQRRHVFSGQRTKSEKGRGLRKRSLLRTPAACIRGARAIRTIPGWRHWLETRGRGRRGRDWAAKTVWATWCRQHIVHVAQGECARVAAVNLEVVQLEGVLARGGAGTGSRRGSGKLTSVGIKFSPVASHQWRDARQRGCGKLLPLFANVHGQPGGEVRVHKLWAVEHALIRLDSMLALNTGHFCRAEPQELLFNIDKGFLVLLLLILNCDPCVEKKKKTTFPKLGVYRPRVNRERSWWVK